MHGQALQRPVGATRMRQRTSALLAAVFRDPDWQSGRTRALSNHRQRLCLALGLLHCLSLSHDIILYCEVLLGGRCEEEILRDPLTVF